MPAADVYTQEVHTQLKRYANWLPTDKVDVGAVGQLQGKIFVPVTNLSSFGISVKVVKDPSTQATYKFMSSGIREVALQGSASGAPALQGGSAKLNITFGKAHSVYFSLAQCSGSSIENLVDLGDKILKKVQDGHWQLDFVVVTRVVTAGSATIMQAESKGASVELEGDASNTPVAELLKAGASVKVKSQDSVALSIVAERKLSPLLSLAKVKYTFLDRLTGSEPKFSCTLARNTVGVRHFGSQIDTTPNVDLISKTATKNDLSLNLKLPKYGDHVDITDLLDLTAKTAVFRPTNSIRVVGGDFNPILNSRIPAKRLLSVVDKLSYVNVDKKNSAGSFINLNLTLPKSGANVKVEPLVKLAIQAAAPKARATVSTELFFDEIS